MSAKPHGRYYNLTFILTNEASQDGCSYLCNSELEPFLWHIIHLYGQHLAYTKRNTATYSS